MLDAPPLYDRPGGPYGDAERQRPPRQLAPLRRARPRRRRRSPWGMLPEFLPDLVHAHDWQAGLAPAYLRYYGVPRPSVMTDPQHRLPGPLPRRRLRPRSSCRRRPSRLDGVEYYGGVGFLKAGLANAERDHHRQPDLCRGDHDAGLRHGARRADRRPRRRAARHRQRHRHRGLEPRDRPACSPRPSRRASCRAAPPTARAVEARFGLHADGSPALRAGQPADLAEGHRPARLGHRAGHRRAPAQASPCSAAASRASRPTFRALAAEFPGRVGVVIGYDEPLAHRHAGRRRRHPHPVALRALRADPALRPALRLRAGRRARRRPRRHGDRRQHRGAERRRRHRLPVHAGRRRAARRRRSAARSRSCATARPGPRCSARA